MPKQARFEMRIAPKKLALYRKIAKAAKMSLADWIIMKCDGEYVAPKIAPVVRTKADLKKPAIEMNGRKPFVCLLKGI